MSSSTGLVPASLPRDLPSLSHADLRLDSVRPVPVHSCGTSVVFIGRWNGQKVAIKSPRKSGGDGDGDEVILDREAFFLDKLSASHVVQFLGVATGVLSPDGVPSPRRCLVLEWMEQGNLVDFLRRNTKTDRVHIFILVVKALDYIHGQGVIHSSLQGTNILINAKGGPCLCGFGLARNIGEPPSKCNTAPIFSRAPVRWQAQELLLEDHSQRTINSDIYAVACVAVEIFTEKQPYAKRKNDAGVVCEVVKGGLPMEFADVPVSFTMRRQVWELIVRCWDADPNSRPSSHELVCELERLSSTHK